MEDIHLNYENASLFVRTETGAMQPATGQQILEAAMTIIGRQVNLGCSLQSPGVVRDYVRLKLSGLEHEVFAMLLLDSQLRLVAYEELFRGTIDGCMVYSREVLKLALAKNAAAVIIAHNHPSGMAEPSQNDRRLTEKLKEALRLVDIQVLDHLVVGGDTVVSFAERGWI